MVVITGNGVIFGTILADTIYGRIGHDDLSGDAGIDFLSESSAEIGNAAEPVDDTVFAGSGADYLVGNSAFIPSAPDDTAGVTAASLDFQPAASVAEAEPLDVLPLREKNGSLATTATVAASGDQRIDGLLSGVKWAGSITYSNPDSTADYGPGHPEYYYLYSQLSTSQLLAVHAALSDTIYTQPLGAYTFSVAGFTNVSIAYAGPGNGTSTIRLANVIDPTAYAYLPNNDVWGGDAFFGDAGDFPMAGNYDYHTVIHELGHSLGLKHGQDTGGYGALPAAWDSMEFSVMTYRSYIGDPMLGYANETWGYAQTFMMLDIAALQHMYGAELSHNGGNTVYTWSPTTGDSYVNGNLAIDPGGNRVFSTIWDGNGIDTYDLSNYSTNLSIDLTPGGHSIFSSAQLAYLGGGPNNGYARGNVFNALQYNGDAGSLIENASGGSGNDTIRGNQADNLLEGNGGNDGLYGGGGNDGLYGGAGSDRLEGGIGDHIYVGVGLGDLVVETAGGGVDHVFTSIHFVLPYYVEHLTLEGSADIGGTGNTADNMLIGNGGHNDLMGDFGDDEVFGHGGDDVLKGGYGSDRLYGGIGNDELLGESGDDDLFGDEGDDRLDGGYGSDRLEGGSGNDTYVIDDLGDLVVETDDSGIDLVFAGINFVLPEHVENLILDYFADSGSGNAADNLIRGNIWGNVLAGGLGDDALYGEGGNDTLDGGSGNDHLEGGSGNDTYVVDSLGDVVIEADGGGIDLIEASLSHTLAAEIENLTLTGDAQINAIGNALDNALRGNGATNLMNGGAGGDRMFGGLGDDTYIVDDARDRVSETLGEGIDTVRSSVSHTLAHNVENLVLLGRSGLAGTGNTLSNVMTGNAGSNALSGGGGDDRIAGGAGADRLLGGTGCDFLTGGAGADLFVFRKGETVAGALRDVIQDFDRGSDAIDLAGIDANAGRRGDQAFTFVGVAAFSETAGELRCKAGILSGDVDGDGVADLQIALTDVARLGVADLLL